MATAARYPHVEGEIIDLSQIIRGPAGVPCAIVGEASRGPVGVPTLNTGSDSLVAHHGAPHPRYGYALYEALCALEVTRQLYFVRVVNGARHGSLLVSAAGASSPALPLAVGPTEVVDEDPPDPIVVARDESVGLGDGAVTQFLHTLVNSPVTAIESISVGGAPLTNLVVDLVAGTIAADGLATSGSTVNRTTGVLNLNFADPVEDGDAVTVTYRADAEAPLFYVFAKDPGTWNNNLSIKITGVDAVAGTFYIEEYERVRGFDRFVKRHFVARRQQFDGNNRQMYIEDRIANDSDRIRVIDNILVPADAVPDVFEERVYLEGGTDGSAVTTADVARGWRAFDNPRNIDVRLLLNGGYVTSTDASIPAVMNAIVERRRDCVAFFDLPFEETDMDPFPRAVTWVNTVLQVDNWRTRRESMWIEVFDTYNGINVMIPSAGFSAQCFVRRFYQDEPWKSPAGMTWGKIRSTVLPPRRLAVSYDEGMEELLANNKINYYHTEPEGLILWTAFTGQMMDSALDHQNVATLAIVNEIAAKAFLKYRLHENNNPTNRTIVREQLDAYFRSVMSREGVEGFTIRCDETNNGPEVRAQNQFNCEVRYVPQYSTDVITFTQTVLAAGAFTEITLNGQPI